MKKVILFFMVLVTILSVFTSCGNEKKSKRPDFSYPIEFRADIKFDGRDYKADVTIHDEANIKIAFLFPDNLKDATLEMKNGECFLNVFGITLPITDGGYSSDNGLLLLRHLFSFSASDFTDGEVVKIGGVRYSVDNYKTDGGKISAYYSSNTKMPDKISASLYGHEIEIIIVK